MSREVDAKHVKNFTFGPFGTEWAACHRVAVARDCDFAVLVYPKAPEHQAETTATQLSPQHSRAQRGE